ncbi:uncharacterized protein [Antedon mediterranea]|uniref:uncharacterized protein isoform X1 n=1 Tax=Antedon mediterranea TaxID=105859 RepID=UPI003AF4CE24
MYEVGEPVLFLTLIDACEGNSRRWKYVDDLTIGLLKKKMSFEFPGLLADISKIYTGEKLFWLRLLLYDHCTGELLSRRIVTGHDLFNQLTDMGYISYEPNDASCTDVEILVDIAEVTKETRALQIIQKFKQKHKNNNKNYNFTRGKPISEYRKNLFKALRSNTTDLLATMPGHYGLNPADFKNKWDLVFMLEGNNDVEEGDIEKMKHFAKILDEDAKEIFLQTQTHLHQKEPGKDRG